MGSRLLGGSATGTWWAPSVAALLSKGWRACLLVSHTRLPGGGMGPADPWVSPSLQWPAGLPGKGGGVGGQEKVGQYGEPRL